MSRFFMKFCIVKIIAASTLWICLPATAQLGRGAEGANRRMVAGGSGYGAVAGKFFEPDFNVPETNTNRSSPSFYLGGRSGAGTNLEVDAGYYWDSEPVRERSGRRRILLQPGWSRFLRVSDSRYSGANGWYSPAVNPRRIARGGLNAGVTMQFVIRDGAVELTVSGADAWNKTALIANRNFSAASVRAMNVKRVIALTQGSGVVLDGSWSHNNVFTGGNVARWSRSTLGQLTYTWQGRWTADDNPNLFTPNRDRADNWIVDFAAPDRRTGNGGTTTNTARRYNNETVHMSLLDRRPGVAGRLTMPGYQGNY